MNDIVFTAAFQKAVHAVVAEIPPGKVMTYGRVAELAGMPGAAREVGRIMSLVKGGQNLPCHRVVNKSGALSPDFAFGGEARQRAMLEVEGVHFTLDGRIDMRRHQAGDHEQLTFL